MIPRVNILGMGVSHITPVQAVQYFDEFIKSGGHHYVCVSNVYSAILCQKDEVLRRIHNEAHMVTPDGKPLCWVQTLMGHPLKQRVYGPDLMLDVCADGIEKGYKHYLYGGRDGVPQRLAELLKERYPGIQVVGAASPPFGELPPEEQDRYIQEINESGADIVWVGLGGPRQEYWMGKHFGRVNAAVMIGVGAAFDFHTGDVRQAPAWIRNNGLEWFFRLCMEPRRLWKRYVYSNPVFVILVLLQLLGLKKYTLNGQPHFSAVSAIDDESKTDSST